MDPNSRSGWSLNSQLNALAMSAPILTAVASIGLGAWLINQIASQGGAASSTTLWVITLVVAVLAVVAVAFAQFRMRALLRTRVSELTEICRQVSMGERNARAVVQGEDEYSMLAAALNTVLDGMPAGGRPSLAESQEAAVLQAQIEKLLQEVSAVGDGDLRVQAEVTPDTLGVLADSFNYMIEELAKVVGRVQATTLQVMNATRRLLDRSAEVAHASEGQALQISQTSEAVARLADFVQLSANNALAAAEAARDALRNAQGGQQAVVQTIDGMIHIRENVQETSKKIKRLGERSQEVGEIVRLIEDIADQTNLLALNAAIQSAMAGEHGRGFAVVADEIRVLAERVTEATKKIATIVKSIQGDTYEAVVAMEESTQEVVNGSRLADEAGRSLQSIYSAVDRQAQMISDIARAAGERKQTAEAVSAAMQQIADITRQTSSATQDTTTSVSYLAELAEQLRASVATFRLPDQIAEAAGLLPPAGGTTNYPGAMGAPLSGAMQLPSLEAGDWGGDGMPLPALAPRLPAPANMGGYDYNSYDGYGSTGGYDPQANYGATGTYDGFTGGYDGAQGGYGAFGAGAAPQMPPFPQEPAPQTDYSEQPFTSGPLGKPPFPTGSY